MRLWPRRRPRDLSRAELLDGLGQLAANIRVEHRHTVKQERIPRPPGGELVIKLMDGSSNWRHYVNCGRQAWTRIDVPMTVIDYKASAGEFFTIEFQWHD